LTSDVVIALADGGEFVNVKGALSLFGLTQSVAFQLGHQRSWMASALSLGAADHHRPHRGVTNRTPHEAFLVFAVPTKNEAPHG